MPFEFEKLEIPDLILVRSTSFDDSRGFFAETYKRSVFAENGIPDEFVQDNVSHSMKGILRGLHYQLEPAAQAKLLMVLAGEIFDVAVDIRKGSPTYGKWVGLNLAAPERTMLYVPTGFAHGFCVLSDEATVHYKVTAEFALDLERGIVWNDPEIGIQWPIAEPELSHRDLRLPPLAEAENNFG